jgi:hypothetical protein
MWHTYKSSLQIQGIIARLCSASQLIACLCTNHSGPSAFFFSAANASDQVEVNPRRQVGGSM